MSHSRKSDTAVKQSCGSDPSRARRQIGQNHCETREFCPKGEEKRDFTKEEEPCSVVNWAKSLRNKRILPKRSRKARFYQGRGAVSRGKLGKIVEKQESFAQKEKKNKFTKSASR